jgi:hypothetical protein
MKIGEFTPILINSYKTRKPFIDVCLFYLNKFFADNEIYLVLDEEISDFKDVKNLNILTYDTIERTSADLRECHSRYYRHYYTLKYFESLNVKYVVNYMDDGWIGYISYNLINKAIDYLNQSNFDRIDLCGPLRDYKLQYINEDISYIVPTDCVWYFHNQCAIWKVDTLIKIYEALGPVSDPNLERYGSSLCKNMDFKFLTFNYNAINNEGCFQRTVGFNERGVELLNLYCKNTDKNFGEEFLKFNQFI